jgi:hypothetical protein
VLHIDSIFADIEKGGRGILVEKGGKLYSLALEESESLEKGKGHIFTREDSLWNIVGMAEGGEPHDTSEHVHQAIADAYESYTS